MAVIGFVSVFTLGCGSSNVSGNGDFVYTGTNTNPSNNGTVNFEFERLLAQADVNISADVPADTSTLEISFFDADGISDTNYIFGREVAFANNVSVSGVPTSASFVVITTYDVKGYPISTISDELEVTGGSSTTVDLSDADNKPVLFQSVTVSPNPINLAVAGTRQAAVAASFSNGDTVPAPVADAEYLSSLPSVATVSTTGVVTAVANGSSSVSATLDIRGTERTGSATVQVGPTGSPPSHR